MNIDNQNNEEIIEPENQDEFFEEVFDLTNYDNREVVNNEENSLLIAEYDNIDIVKTTQNQQKKAKRFIQEVKRMMVSYAGNGLSSEISKYLSTVAALQIEQLGDLLTMLDINKQMLGNMVRRINTFQADDYALIQTYTNLLQQHIRLHKEVQNNYSGIPALMKRMTTDIDTELLQSNTPDNPVISESHGETQFNSSKEMLLKLKEKIESKQNDNKNDSK